LRKALEIWLSGVGLDNEVPLPTFRRRRAPAARFWRRTRARMDGRRGAPACSLLAAALASGPRGMSVVSAPDGGTELRRKYALASRTLSAQTRML
jgi:hypothetical protein